MTTTQILNKVKRYKSKYSRIYKTRCIDSMFRFENEDKDFFYSRELGVTISLSTGLFFNLLNNPRNYDWIGDVIKGQLSPEEVSKLTDQPVGNYEMLSEKELKKVTDRFGGTK